VRPARHIAVGVAAGYPRSNPTPSPLPRHNSTTTHCGVEADGSEMHPPTPLGPQPGGFCLCLCLCPLPSAPSRAASDDARVGEDAAQRSVPKNAAALQPAKFISALMFACMRGARRGRRPSPLAWSRDARRVNVWRRSVGEGTPLWGAGWRAASPDAVPLCSAPAPVHAYLARILRRAAASLRHTHAHRHRHTGQSMCFMTLSSALRPPLAYRPTCPAWWEDLSPLASNPPSNLPERSLSSD
jgi:hypothetical protein